MTECACNVAADWQAARNWVFPAGRRLAGQAAQQLRRAWLEHGYPGQVNVQAWRRMGQDFHTYSSMTEYLLARHFDRALVLNSRLLF